MDKLSKNRVYLIASFAIVFGWVMSLPYQGPVLFAYGPSKNYDGGTLNMLSVFCHFVGLFLGRYLTKSSKDAKRVIQLKLVMTIMISLALPFLPGTFWTVLVPVLALLTGLVITSYGHLIYDYIPLKMSLKSVADFMIYGNVVLISAHIFAHNTQALVGFVWIEILLVIALILVNRIDVTLENPTKELKEATEVVALKEYWIFFLFIFVITLNSGIMFQVIYPYFSEFGLLQSIYTNIPYIAVIYILSRYVKINRFYSIYAGLILWGITFLLFTLVGPTALGFILVCTVMLMACGIFDLFWWSVMASNLGRVKNPVSFFGLGLSINVLGVWSGGMLGQLILTLGGDKQELAIIGMFIVIISMVIMVALNVRLSRLLIYTEFLFKLEEEEALKEDAYEAIKEVLSKREYEVFYLLLMGKTDTQISGDLNISKHTIKTHNRNIYRKLEVSNRVQLIEKYQG